MGALEKMPQHNMGQEDVKEDAHPETNTFQEGDSLRQTYCAYPPRPRIMQALPS